MNTINSKTLSKSSNQHPKSHSKSSHQHPKSFNQYKRLTQIKIIQSTPKFYHEKLQTKLFQSRSQSKNQKSHSNKIFKNQFIRKKNVNNKTIKKCRLLVANTPKHLLSEKNDEISKLTNLKKTNLFATRLLLCFTLLINGSWSIADWMVVRSFGALSWSLHVVRPFPEFAHIRH